MSERVGRGEAPAKAILLGEHAVVYGYPAIAVPLPELHARAQARFDASIDDLLLELPERGQTLSLQRQPEQPLLVAAFLGAQAVGATAINLRLRLESNIPIASGLGSGAATAAAIMRALANLFDRPVPPARLSDLVYEVERIHHGTPSGIDNTVVVYGQPTYFIKGQAPEFLQLAAPFHLIVADTGVPSPTRETVSALRQQREASPVYVNARLEAIGHLVEQARQALALGDMPALGQLLDACHGVLSELGLSGPELDNLVRAARAGGALGAKLTGAGRGGNMIALVAEDAMAPVCEALRAAGARRITLCRVG
jgi:mevalonate kinase